MALSPGTRIGVYEVVGLLGAGGMGEVYRARDTRLDRDVALKVLPESLALDGDRLARFKREAQLLASLNHPNIGAIHGFEEFTSTGPGYSGHVSALVLELIEGPTLAERIAQGRLPIDDVIPIARQIANALESAHDQGIVHRDLKPANIKLRPDGTVKVLDFGLAKAMDSGSMGSGPYNATYSPTLTVHATYAGVILGTAAYMSPEQARGKPVDRRTDIWAFGCVLYEMLTGKQTFDAGETVSDAIATILKGDVDWNALPGDVPPHIHSIVRRCLQKDPQKRLPHIGVVRLELDEPTAPTAAPAANATRVEPPPRRWWRHALPAGASSLNRARVSRASRSRSPRVWNSPRSLVNRWPCRRTANRSCTRPARRPRPPRGSISDRFPIPTHG
jgi:serine/threonine protein kinase